MGEGSGSVFSLVPILLIVFLACPAQASTPVSPPESRFVWEPGENLTFTWTNENFDGFYYDAQSMAGNESLTIKLDNFSDRWIKQDNIVYSTKIEQATTRYRPFGEYAFIGFLGQKYLAGFPDGKSNITSGGGIYPGAIYKILIDENTNHNLSRGIALTLNEYYVLKVVDVNAAGVVLSLRRYGIEIDTKTIDTGNNYVYEIRGRPVIAVHIDSIFKENGTFSAKINGIFQISEQYTSTNEREIFGVMKITKVSNRSITMKNTDNVDLKRGSIFEIIGNIKLKVADSNTLQLHLYSDSYEKHEHRGAAGSNNLAAWDGLNYAGFLYDADSGNYSESLVITNLTGRRIPEGGLTYTSYIRRVPYAVTKVTGEKIPGTDGSYVSFDLGGKKYTAKNNGFAELLIGHGESISEKKLLLEKPPWFEGVDEAGQPVPWEDDTWELGEGYTLTVKFIDETSDPRKARLVLRKNDVDLDDIWLSSGNAYRYFQPGETGTPKLTTYLEAVFSGATVDAIQLRYTWFVSDNVIQIKVGNSFGVFNAMVMEPDRMVLKNRGPIELKAGSSINLFGNLSFFVENSDEFRFYPTSMGGTGMMLEEFPANEVPDIPESTLPATTIPAVTPSVAGRTESLPGFEIVISLAALFAVYRIKGGKDE